MLKKQDMSRRDQIGFYSLEDLVPKEHLLRDIDLDPIGTYTKYCTLPELANTLAQLISAQK